MNAKDLKFLALVAGGVLIAGWIMNFGRDVGLLDAAHEGFDR